MKKYISLLILILYCISVGAFAQSVKISGTITDTNGESLIGCSVVIKGTTTGTMTDIDGKYSLTANVGDILHIAYIGFKDQDVKVEQEKIVYNIVLKENEQQLTDVVVVGYGVVRKQSSSIISMPKSAYDKQDSEEYTEVGENKFKSTTLEPVSTLSADVDKASYSNTRRMLEQGIFPPCDAVRTEELINYFPYTYKQPTMDAPITIEGEVGKCPWNTSSLLCKIGVKTREIPKDNLPPSNFVFLIDVSGSMDGPIRLGLVKLSLSLLADNLSDKDRVSIVVYSGNAGLVLPSTSGKDKMAIKNALLRLEAGGSTAGGEGILLAYKIAKDNFIKGGNNRIILCTDGDFNVGVSSNKGLEDLIEEQRKSGVFLSILGYGMGNYKDSKMQTLAQKGNGNHAYIDSQEEANRVLVTEFAGTLYTVAKDVKLQVAFNPNKVDEYRLIGYETRLLNKEDFENDLVDAGDMGSGHTVTALYELKPAANAIMTGNDKLFTINMRYKDPQKEDSRLISIPVADKVEAQSSTDLRFASSIAMFAQLIRNSEFKGNATFKDVEKLASASLGKDKNGYRKEFLRLVKIADNIISESARTGKPLRYGNLDFTNRDFEEYTDEVDGKTMYGMKDLAGKIVVPALYNEVEHLRAGIFRVKKDDKCGLYQNYSGLMVPLKYDEIRIEGIDMFRTELDNKYGMIDIYGKEVFAPIFDDINNVMSNSFIAKKEDKQGVYSISGKEIVPVRFDNIYIEYKELIIVEDDNKYGVYNAKGKQLLPVKYKNIEQEGYFYVIETFDNKYGVINEDGKIIASPQFESSPERLGRDCFLVKKKDKEGVMNKNGKIIVPIKYKDIDDLTEDIFSVRNEKDLYGAYNSKGKKIANEIYDDIEEFNYTKRMLDEGGLLGYILLEKDNKQGLMSASGKMILPVVYDDIDSEALCDNGEQAMVLITEKEDKYGAHMLDGTTIVPEVFDDVDVISETECHVHNASYNPCLLLEKDNKHGLISVQKNISLPVIYDDIECEELPNKDFIIIVAKNDICIAYNSDGKKITQKQYEAISFMSDTEYLQNEDGTMGCLEVETNGKSGIITMGGKMILPRKYDYVDNIQQIVNGVVVEYFFLVKAKEKYGLTDKRGKIIIPLQYDKMQFDTTNNTFNITKNGENFVINLAGDKVE